MKKSILILGGARSGKSSRAVALARGLKKRTVFIATCTFADPEMQKRIKKHQRQRPRHWKVVEEGKDINAALLNLKDKYQVVLIDCLGLWISNLLAGDLSDRQIEKQVSKLIGSLSNSQAITILVSNEVGAGIVPDNPLARRFRDLLGAANQKIARQADEVILMYSGIPLTIKGEQTNAKIR